MVVLSAQIQFHVPDTHSLKEKRRVCRSLIDGSRNKFNLAIAEVDTQNLHQLLTLGIAVVSSDGHHAKTMLNAVIFYLEENAQAQLTDVQFFE